MCILPGGSLRWRKELVYNSLYAVKISRLLLILVWCLWNLVLTTMNKCGKRTPKRKYIWLKISLPLSIINFANNAKAVLSTPMAFIMIISGKVFEMCLINELRKCTALQCELFQIECFKIFDLSSVISCVFIDLMASTHTKEAFYFPKCSSAAFRSWMLDWA